ncbi:hypothetical protein [Flavobacterium sp. UBA4197]|uniref:hypothetical protein n=1 Tax=Flavobacterium sp. UBA4197 TaxID=1946546 RepID=UPI00257C5FA6|nr:hypothetical protein [Flavobacterium sp. UBA4197]HRB72432.1 hypothetical protein [Flavobacterium sp.]
MSFKTPTKSNLATGAGYAVGAAGGGFATRAVVSAIAKPANEATPTGDELNKKGIYHGLAALLGFAGFAFAYANNAPSLVQGAAIGTAAINTLDCISTFVKKGDIEVPNTTAGKAIKNGLGLGCACSDYQNQGTAERAVYYPSLNQPTTANLTWDELRAMRDNMVDQRGINPLLQVNDNAWKQALSA